MTNRDYSGEGGNYQDRKEHIVRGFRKEISTSSCNIKGIVKLGKIASQIVQHVKKKASSKIISKASGEENGNEK